MVSKKIHNSIQILREAKKIISDLQLPCHPEVILREAAKAVETYREGSAEEPDKKLVCKAMSLHEFQNGLLLSMAVSDLYNTLAVDMLRKIQKEYDCTSISEQATAELASLCYVRTLHIQTEIANALDKGGINNTGIKFIEVMSKELDRAVRHYLNAIQTLRMLKQPPLNLSIKTNSTFVGQNQFVQKNQYVNNSI
ncbi:hypothetical protein KBC70_01980 [Candidatus Woesebacteria bacterium]|nr:hypothetical protein [Candidatus Woesebacteria bacterium]